MRFPSSCAVLLSCILGAGCSPSPSDGDAAPVPATPTPADVELVQAKDCDALRATAVSSLTEAVLHARYGGIRIDDKLGGKGDDTQVPDAEPVELESAPPPVEAEDLVKVVGQKLFIISDTQMSVVAVDDAGQLSAAGYFGVGDGLTAAGLFADDAIAVLFHTIDADDTSTTFPGTRVTILNVADPAQPKLVEQLDIEGDFEIARREGDTFDLVTSSRWRVDSDIWDIAYGDSATLPKPEPNGGDDRQVELRDLARADVSERVGALLPDATSLLPRVRVGQSDPSALLDCEAIWATTPASSVRLTTVSRFGGDGELTSFAIVGDDFAGAVSNGALFAAFSDRWGAFAGESRLHMFRWSEGYASTQRLPGRLLDEHSIAASGNDVSVITVDGGAALHAFARDGGDLEAADPAPLSADDLVVANRITADTAFVATHGDSERIYALPFGQTDVTGPFEVGGVPTMIHALTNEQFLVVAQELDASDEQVGVRIEVFESETDPVATASVTTGNYAAWSEAMWEPRSLAYSAGLVAFPVNIESWADADGANFSGVLVYDTADGITRRAAIDHSDLSRLAWCSANDQPEGCNAPSTAAWWTHVRRSVFVGDWLVTISDVGIKAHSVSDFEELSALPL